MWQKYFGSHARENIDIIFLLTFFTAGSGVQNMAMLAFLFDCLSSCRNQYVCLFFRQEQKNNPTMVAAVALHPPWCPTLNSKA